MRQRKVYLVLSLDIDGSLNIVKIFSSKERAENFRLWIEEEDAKSAKELGCDPDIYYVKEYVLN